MSIFDDNGANDVALDRLIKFISWRISDTIDAIKEAHLLPTARERYAAAALTGLLANEAGENKLTQVLAFEAFELADAMIEEARKRDE